MSTSLNVLACAGAVALLGVGSIYWLTFAHGTHDFRRQLSQESRHAEVVGARPLPKAPIKITIRLHRNSPIVIDRIERDGDDTFVYYRNVTDSAHDYIKIMFMQHAPDGTIIGSSGGYASIYGDGPDHLEAGEKAEAHFNFKADPRTVELVVNCTAD